MVKHRKYGTVEITWNEKKGERNKKRIIIMNMLRRCKHLLIEVKLNATVYPIWQRFLTLWQFTAKMKTFPILNHLRAITYLFITKFEVHILSLLFKLRIEVFSFMAQTQIACLRNQRGRSRFSFFRLIQPRSSSARNEWLVMNCKGPWEGNGKGEATSTSRLTSRRCLLPAFLCAHVLKRDVWVRGSLSFVCFRAR